ncbi:MAG: hypothetical protein ABI903_16510 [Actinomycetota bacterium]
MTPADLLFACSACALVYSSVIAVTEYLAAVRFDRLDGTTPTKEQ